MSQNLENTEALKNFIHGTWVEVSTNQYQNVHNPKTREAICRVPISSFSDVDDAVESAQKAFLSWKRTPVTKRARILFRYQQLLMENREEITNIIMKENGKSFEEAYREVLRGIEYIELACGTPSFMKGENISKIASNTELHLYRYPLGVVAGIASFDFPITVACWLFPLAIACGNTFVFKPSEHSPMVANRLAALFADAGLPEGVLNVVHGVDDVMNGLLFHENVKAITFVGSESVAKDVYEKAVQNGKRVQAYAAARNYHLVMPDKQTDVSIEQIVHTAFGSAGLRYTNCSAVIVVGDGDAFIERLVNAVCKINIGKKLEYVFSPMNREENYASFIRNIQTSIKEGARLLVDGSKDVNGSNSNFLGPTVIDHVKVNMPIMEEASYAPVLCILRAENLEVGLEMINSFNYGNVATIYTNQADVIRKFQEDAEAGMLGVNIGFPAPIALFPFSGTKQTYYGDVNNGIQFFTSTKLIVSKFENKREEYKW